MPAKTLATALGANTQIAAIVKAIRPVNSSATDERPYIVYERKGIQSIPMLNCKIGAVSGFVNLYICTDTEAQATEIGELVNDTIDCEQVTGTEWKITYCALEEKEDVDQQIDEREKPFYVLAMTYRINAVKLEA